MKKNFTYMLALCAFMIFGYSTAKAGSVTYDFLAYSQAYCASAMEELKLTGETFKVNGTNVTTIGDLDHMGLDGRFAVQNADLKIRLRVATEGGLWNVTGNAGRIVVVKNLKAGDKVSFTSKGITFVAGTIEEDISSGTAVADNKDLTMTEDGNLAVSVDRYSAIFTVTITTAAAETVTSPKIAVTGAYGIERTVTITPGHSDNADIECTTVYSLDGNDPLESPTSEAFSGVDPIDITIDESCTVKAITIGETAQSAVTSLDVIAGDYIELNLALSVAMNDGVATFTASSDNSNIYGAPTATISFAFDGQEAGDGNSFTPTADGTLLVTASADGYGDKEIEVPVYAKYKERWASSDYSTPGIGGDFEGWVYSEKDARGNLRWANWANVEEGYSFYILEEPTANNITLEGDEDGKIGVRMRGIMSFVDGFGIGHNNADETIGNMASRGVGRIAIFHIYNGFNNSDSSYEVGYVCLDGSSWINHLLPKGHCLVQTIAYMGDEQPAPSVATAIQTVNVEKEDNAVFNLQGQRVSNPAHGIFITKGRKVVF